MSLTVFLQTKKAAKGKDNNSKSRKEKKSHGSKKDESASQEKVYICKLLVIDYVSSVIFLTNSLF